MKGVLLFYIVFRDKGKSLNFFFDFMVHGYNK